MVIEGNGRIFINLPSFTSIENWDFEKSIKHPQRLVDMTGFLDVPMGLKGNEKGDN